MTVGDVLKVSQTLSSGAFWKQPGVEVVSQAVLSYLPFVFPHMDVISPNLPGFVKWQPDRATEELCFVGRTWHSATWCLRLRGMHWQTLWQLQNLRVGCSWARISRLCDRLRPPRQQSSNSFCFVLARQSSCCVIVRSPNCWNLRTVFGCTKNLEWRGIQGGCKTHRNKRLDWTKKNPLVCWGSSGRWGWDANQKQVNYTTGSDFGWFDGSDTMILGYWVNIS